MYHKIMFSFVAVVLSASIAFGELHEIKVSVSSKKEDGTTWDVSLKKKKRLPDIFIEILPSQKEISKPFRSNTIKDCIVATFYIDLPAANQYKIAAYDVDDLSLSDLIGVGSCKINQFCPLKDGQAASAFVVITRGLSAETRKSVMNYVNTIAGAAHINDPKEVTYPILEAVLRHIENSKTNERLVGLFNKLYLSAHLVSLVDTLSSASDPSTALQLMSDIFVETRKVEIPNLTDELQKYCKLANDQIFKGEVIPLIVKNH